MPYARTLSRWFTAKGRTLHGGAESALVVACLPHEDEKSAARLRAMGQSDTMVYAFTRGTLVCGWATRCRPARASTYRFPPDFVSRLILQGAGLSFSAMVMSGTQRYRAPADVVYARQDGVQLGVEVLRLETLLKPPYKPRTTLPTRATFHSLLLIEGGRSAHYVDFERPGAAHGITTRRAIAVRLTLEAKRLLTRRTVPIKQIALELGFSEPQNFTRFFRRETGAPPRRFRETLLA